MINIKTFVDTIASATIPTYKQTYNDCMFVNEYDKVKINEKIKIKCTASYNFVILNSSGNSVKYKISRFAILLKNSNDELGTYWFDTTYGSGFEKEFDVSEFGDFSYFYGFVFYITTQYSNTLSYGYLSLNNLVTTIEVY